MTSFAPRCEEAERDASISATRTPEHVIRGTQTGRDEPPNDDDTDA
jgi:hypothetical protein